MAQPSSSQVLPTLLDGQAYYALDRPARMQHLVANLQLINRYLPSSTPLALHHLAKLAVPPGNGLADKYAGAYLLTCWLIVSLYLYERVVSGEERRHARAFGLLQLACGRGMTDLLSYCTTFVLFATLRIHLRDVFKVTPAHMLDQLLLAAAHPATERANAFSVPALYATICAAAPPRRSRRRRRSCQTTPPTMRTHCTNFASTMPSAMATRSASCPFPTFRSRAHCWIRPWTIMRRHGGLNACCLRRSRPTRRSLPERAILRPTRRGSYRRRMCSTMSRDRSNRVPPLPLPRVVTVHLPVLRRQKRRLPPLGYRLLRRQACMNKEASHPRLPSRPSNCRTITAHCRRSHPIASVNNLHPEKAPRHRATIRGSCKLRSPSRPPRPPPCWRATRNSAGLAPHRRRPRSSRPRRRTGSCCRRGKMSISRRAISPNPALADHESVLTRSRAPLSSSTSAAIYTPTHSARLTLRNHNMDGAIASSSGARTNAAVASSSAAPAQVVVDETDVVTVVAGDGSRTQLSRAAAMLSGVLRNLIGDIGSSEPSPRAQRAQWRHHARRQGVCGVPRRHATSCWSERGGQ